MKLGGQLSILKTINWTNCAKSKEKGACMGYISSERARGPESLTSLWKAVIAWPIKQLVPARMHAWTVVFTMGEGILYSDLSRV